MKTVQRCFSSQYKLITNIKKLLGYDPEIMLWIEKELKKNGDLIFDILTKDQFKQWRRYEERKIRSNKKIS